MTFAFVSRWLGWNREPAGTTVELSCGGRIAVADDGEDIVLTVTTAPDTDGLCHVVAISLSTAERLELGQVLEAEAPLAS